MPAREPEFSSGQSRESDSRSELPIVVDIDGGLLRNRWFDEAVVEVLLDRPWLIFKLPFVLLSDVASREQFVSKLARLEFDKWPKNSEMMAYLKDQADRGRKIILVTSAPEAMGRAVLHSCEFISDIIVLDAETDAQSKAGRLTSVLPQGFVRAAVSSAGVSFPSLTATRPLDGAAGTVMPRSGNADGGPSFVADRLSFTELLSALRVHQWAKNLLVLVPLILGGRSDELQAWSQALTGGLALSFVASAMYLINDLLDLRNDRNHWSKKVRAIPSGALSIRLASALSLVLLVLGLALAASQGPGPLIVVAIYACATMFYSLHWKRVPILDVFVLASLFTLRIWLGIVLTDVRLSPWLLVFSMFLFCSLSLAKRHTEVLRLRSHGMVQAAGRAYRGDDAPLTLALGLSSMMAAVLILILYLIEDAFPRQQYAAPDLLWAVPPILFLFLGRIWLLCQRDQLQDDPVMFAMKDRVSLVLGAAMCVCTAIALVGLGP